MTSLATEPGTLQGQAGLATQRRERAWSSIPRCAAAGSGRCWPGRGPGVLFMAVRALLPVALRLGGLALPPKFPWLKAGSVGPWDFNACGYGRQFFSPRIPWAGAWCFFLSLVLGIAAQPHAGHGDLAPLTKSSGMGEGGGRCNTRLGASGTQALWASG